MKTFAVERAKQLLRYEPDTGRIFWLEPGVGRVRDEAGNGTGSRGYRTVFVDGRSYLAHRLAWALFYGEWPYGPLDHIDGDKQNNRINNLRIVDASMNCENLRKARADSKTQLLGVHLCSRTGKWRAQICVRGRRIDLGRFASPEMASVAYLTAKRRLHEGCSI